MNIDAVALLIMAEYHAGTVNKHDGTLYMLHPIHVAEHAAVAAVAHGLRPEIAKAIGYLHDAVEDTVLTEALLMTRLLEGGVSPQDSQLIVSGVMAMTKRDGEDLETYYQRVKRDEYGRLCKISDMTHNFSRNHLIVDAERRGKMAVKYSLGMSILSFF